MGDYPPNKHLHSPVTLTYSFLPHTSALHTQIPNSQPKWSSRSVSTDLAVLAALSSAMPSSTRTLTSLLATTRSLSLTTPPTCSSTTPPTASSRAPSRLTART